MTASKNGNKTDQSHDVLNKNKTRTAIKASNSRCRKEIAMSYNDASNKLEQEYYNKASGCSVKAQEDNLFDYAFGIAN